LSGGRPTDAHPSDFYLRSANYRIDDEQILDDLRVAAARIDDPLTATVYDRERRLVYQETQSAGRPRALAGVGTIYRHFRSWHTALQAAGIAIPPKGGSTQDQGFGFSREQILGALGEADDMTRDRLTISAYISWRERELQRDPARESELPSYVTVYRRLGGWLDVVEQLHDWRRAAGKKSLRHEAAEPGDVGKRSAAPFTRERLLCALAEAQDGIEGELTLYAYSEWREISSERDPTRRMLLPSAWTIRHHFGGWKNALGQLHAWRRRP
jgi:hypothetical protein